MQFQTYNAKKEKKVQFQLFQLTILLLNLLEISTLPLRLTLRKLKPSRKKKDVISFEELTSI